MGSPFSVSTLYSPSPSICLHKGANRWRKLGAAEPWPSFKSENDMTFSIRQRLLVPAVLTSLALCVNVAYSASDPLVWGISTVDARATSTVHPVNGIADQGKSHSVAIENIGGVDRIHVAYTRSVTPGGHQIAYACKDVGAPGDWPTRMIDANYLGRSPAIFLPDATPDVLYSEKPLPSINEPSRFRNRQTGKHDAGCDSKPWGPDTNFDSPPNTSGTRFLNRAHGGWLMFLGTRETAVNPVPHYLTRQLGVGTFTLPNTFCQGGSTKDIDIFADVGSAMVSCVMNGKAHVTNADGLGPVEIIQLAAGNNSRYTRLKRGSDGIWRGLFGSVYSERLAQNNWTQTQFTPDAVLYRPGLVLRTGANGSVSASVYYGHSGGLKYVTNVSGVWSAPVVIDSSISAGAVEAINMSNGLPAIIYYDLTNKALKAAIRRTQPLTNLPQPIRPLQ
jgi:hypothetical protein